MAQLEQIMNKHIAPHHRRVKPKPFAKRSSALSAEVNSRERGQKRRPRVKPLTLRRAGQFENVLQDLMSPLFKPAVSHCWRCAAEPWVKLSGTA
jgi:hypothetical protein